MKINIYTTLAVHGGQAIAREVLSDLGNIFDQKSLEELVAQGVLGKHVLDSDYGHTKMPLKPKLANVANPPRRDAWFGAVRDRCKDFLPIFNYQRFAR